MDYLPNLFMLAGMHILMAMLPGPNTVVVSWLAATRSRQAGLAAVAGVVLASLVWMSFAVFGVSALLVQAGWLYRGLRLAGAGYLVYVGVRMILARRTPPAPVTAASGTPAAPREFSRSPFVTGLMTTLSNPKSAVFWTSAFLVAVPAHAPAWFYPLLLAVILVQASLWYGGLALFFSTGFARDRYLRLARGLDLVAGSVMIGLGIKVADEVRRELLVVPAT